MNDPIGEVVWEGTGQERVVEEAAAYQQQQCNTRQHQPSVQCSSCKRFFSREADKTRNKCSGERGNPLELQRGLCNVQFVSSGSRAEEDWQFNCKK